MWLVVCGILILLVASLLHSYCAFGTAASIAIAPAIFYSFAGILLQIGWILLFVIGAVMLFVANWIWGIVAVLVYWFLLPLLVYPIVTKLMLPSWDKVKDVLEKQGYTRDNYLRGDWWKKPELRSAFGEWDDEEE